MLAVIGADAAFAGVMVEIAQLGALVEGADGVGAERAKAHRRYVEDRCRVWLAALRPADDDPEAGRVGQWRRAHGVADEFEAGFVHVDQGAEGFVRGFVLRPCIHQRALGAGERQGVAVCLQQVLADFRANGLDQIADVAQDRVVAANCVALLQQVEQADQAEDGGAQGERPQPFVVGEGQARQGEQYTGGEEGIATEK
ncbi:hypothetical protein D3C75_845340 [compost metagenome]